MIRAPELRRMAEEKLSDANSLHQQGRYDGAIYLCGYAIELALKARISETLGWGEFPSETKDFQGLQSFQTHDLDRLLHLSGIEDRILRDFTAEWNRVSTWSPNWRYLQVESTDQTQCAQMLEDVSRVKEAI